MEKGEKTDSIDDELDHMREYSDTYDLEVIPALLPIWPCRGPYNLSDE